MATSKEFFEFVTECLSKIDGTSSRPMMGEYVLYYFGRVFGGIYDNRVLIKITPSSLEFLADARKEIPYPGAKEMLSVDVEDTELLSRLLPAMLDELPIPKKRK